MKPAMTRTQAIRHVTRTRGESGVPWATLYWIALIAALSITLLFVSDRLEDANRRMRNLPVAPVARQQPEGLFQI